MGSWFGSQPQSPIDAESREWIEGRWRWLTSTIGGEGTRDVILPTPRFFPDPYAIDEESVRRLFDRVCGYIGVLPGSIELAIFTWDNPVHDDNGPLGSAPMHWTASGNCIARVPAKLLNDPLALIATFARHACRYRLMQEFHVAMDAELESLSDLCSVYLGMGIISANAALRESNWHAGAVSGWSMSRYGALSMDMFGYALALFARDRREESPAWQSELRPDVRAAFDASRRFLAADAEVDKPSPPQRSIDPTSHAIRDSLTEPVAAFPPPFVEDLDSAVADSFGESESEFEPAVRRRREPVFLSDRFEFVGRMVRKIFFGLFGGMFGAIFGGLLGGGVEDLGKIKGASEVGAGIGFIAFAVLALLQVVKRPN
jgi:hypothetical protein